jgi:hypothetical protein
MARRKRGQAVRWAARRDEWRQNLAAWAASGQTQAAYCRAQGLDQNALSSWKRRLNWAAAVQTEETAAVQAGERLTADLFVPVTVRPRVTGASAPVLEIVLRNGRILRAGLDAEPVVLTRWAAALES